MKALPGFPELKVGDWMPTLIRMYGLSEAPKAKHHLYRVAHDCCKGAKTRRRQKQSLIPECMAEVEAADNDLPENQVAVA